MKLTILPRWFKRLIKRSSILMSLNTSVRWQFHLLKDWWGTVVWTRTTVVVTPLGFKLTSGFHPAYDLMRSGAFEVDETRIVSKLLIDIDQFVDVGANLGYYTCLALQNGKPVIAVEPQQQNLRCLFSNLIINGWQDKAEVFPLALSERPGLMTLYGASGPSASLVKNWAGYSPRYKKTIPVSTLDNVLAGRFLNKRLFIKIDVEGAEYQVLLGGRETLARTIKPVWLLEICLQEFHPEGKNPDFNKIFDLFFENGYFAYTAAEKQKLVTSKNIIDWDGSNCSDSGVFNYIFVGAKNILQEV